MTLSYTNLKLWLRLPLLLIFIMFPEALYADGDQGLDNKPAAELLGRASSYIEADTLLDRAVAALSVVANRYYADPGNKSIRKDAAVAMNQLGRIYSFRLYDFRKAYTNLSTARMIAEEDGDDWLLAEILTNLANIYHTCSDIDDKIRDYAVQLISEALGKAIKSGNEEVITRIAGNMAIISFDKPDWGVYRKDADIIRKYNKGKTSPDAVFRQSIIAAMDFFFKKNYPQAEIYLKKALASIGNSPYIYRERFEQGAMFILQFVYDRQGKYEEEEELIKKRLKIAKERGLSDYEMYAYESMSRFYDRIGKPDSVRKYENLFLELKSKLDQETGMHKITEMEMLRQIEEANDEVRELSVKRNKEKRRLTAAVAVIVIVVVLLLTFVCLFLNLRRNHKLLFLKNRELLDREEQLRMLMDHKKPASESGADTCEIDEESKSLFARILRVMEEDRDIFGMGFGLDDLSSILGVSQRSVSRAINVCSGTNFHSFLNGYRIREACRLMRITDQSSTTVEYIAETVGFRSRTSFASLFKKTTGLTPSEYWKMARKGQ